MTQNSLKWILNTTFKKMTAVIYFYVLCSCMKLYFSCRLLEKLFFNSFFFQLIFYSTMCINNKIFNIYSSGYGFRCSAANKTNKTHI